MISPSQVNLRNVVANCVTFSLLILPSFASAQGMLGSPSDSSGIQVESATQEPTVVTLPGAIPEGDQNDDGSNTKAAVDAETMGEIIPDSSDEDDGAEQTLEQRRAAWMADLESLTFSELVKRIRQDEQKINQLYISIPLGYPAKQKEFQNAIQALQGEVVVLNQLLEPAAVEAFRSDPTGSQSAATKVFEVLESKLSPRGRQGKYDPKDALRLVNTILEIKGGGIGTEPGVKPLPEDEPFIRVIFQGYLASYGLEDFGTAEAFLTRLENMDIGLDPKVRETFEATLAAWEEEQKLRTEETRVDNLPRVKLETTDGDVVIELFENQAPNTVANFIKLTKEGYYDGLEFFQVVPSSYARSGCTANDGTTHPGYRIKNEFENGRRHFAGTVVMQNDGENTAGSQFIILHRPDPNLEGKVVSFGRVIEGLENIYLFKTVNRIRNAGGEATIINKATVVRAPSFEYKLETIDENSGLLFDDPNKVLPEGLSSQTPSGSLTRPGTGVLPAVLPPSGYSTRPVVPSGSSTRPSGSSTRPSGSLTRP